MNPSQLLMIDLSGPSLSKDEKAFLADHAIGGVCLFSRNVRDAEQLAEFTHELRSLCGEELLVAVDQEGGGVVRIDDIPYGPGSMALGAADDVSLTRDVAAATARGLAALGINVNFAPVADVNNTPFNPVIGDRAFGEIPEDVARHVCAFVQGTQAEGVAATVKHFPGHGDTAIDSHEGLPVLDVDLDRLERVELLPFRAAFKAGVACVMSYHGRVSALDKTKPASLSKNVMTSFLREHLGFDGVSFSDALEMKAISQTIGAKEAVLQAIEAGIDMPLYNIHGGSLLAYEAVFKALDGALIEGRLDQQALQYSLQRLKRLARRYFVRPNPKQAWQKGDKALLRHAARRAITTVGNFTPLQKDSLMIILSAKNVLAGAAGEEMPNPANELVEALQAQGFSLEHFMYDREHPDKALKDVLAKLDRNGNTYCIFVSTSRLRMNEAEKQLGLMLAKTAKKFLHIALWNPYHVQDLPGPALIAFGFRPWSIKALVEVMQDGQTSGVLPINLSPA